MRFQSLRGAAGRFEDKRTTTTAATTSCGMRLSALWLLLMSVVCCAVVGQQPDSSSSSSSSLELKYRIEEEQSAGTFVGDVVHDANLERIYDRAALRQLQFRFLRHSAMFAIDSNRGVISTNSRIDREVLCPGAENCDIRLDVVIQPHSHFRQIRVIVTIIDLNDNTPAFDAAERTVEVPEMAVVGSVIYVPSAVDLDSPGNSVQKYALVSDSDRFELTEDERKPEGEYDTRLVLVKGLDRESIDDYYVKVLAVDGGFPRNTGSVNIRVRVTDVNDNKPVFDNPVYNVTVAETLPPGTTVQHVHATDNDVDLNGEVAYSFSLQTLAAFGHLFGINNRTGDIYIRESLDHEDSAIYRLTVIAQDRGLDSVPVSAVVNVFVSDVNDNAPEVTIATLSSVQGVAEVSEDSPPGTFVAHVSITDKDSGENGRFTCKLNDTSFSMVPVYDSEYRLTTSTVLDRESRSDYDVTLTCSDFGPEPQTSVALLKVIVTDVNDNDPVFSQSVYRDEIHENNYVGAILFQVNATDRDAGNNSRIVYRIEGEASNWFNIEPETGLIKASISFDREENDQMRFYIVAQDQGGSTPRSSSVLAFVTVLDVNDEKPVFSHSGYSFAIHENQPPGSEVGAVAAHDRDSSIYGDVTYSIIPIHGSDSFEIDYKTGMITTTKELDREATSTYTLVVTASDRGVPPLSSTATATVYVSDENDNAPSFEYPTHNNNTIFISNRTPVGHVVTRLRAHDADVGRNARITYEMTDDSKTEMFDLDVELGTVLVRGELLELDGQQYLLEFVAKDDGEPQRTAFARLNIVVNRSVAFLFDPENGVSPMSEHNFMIVVLLAVISVVIIIVLIAAIVVICRQDRNKEANKYNCRTEALKMLSKGVKPSQSNFSNDFNNSASTTAHHNGFGVDDKCHRDFILEPPDDHVIDDEIDGRSLPCYSSFDRQMASNSLKQHQQQHYYPSSSLTSSNGGIGGYGGGAGGGGGGGGGVALESFGSYSDKLSRGNGCHGSKTTVSQHQKPMPLHQQQPQHHHQQQIGRENEVERLLKDLQQQQLEADSDSNHSAEEGSNADSGHGPSEEGEIVRSTALPAHHTDTIQVPSRHMSSRNREPFTHRS